MSTILVKKLPGDNPQRFQVRVEEEDGSSHHEVSLSAATRQRLGADASPEGCIEAAFRFLLDREPKESILGHFDIDMISGYFPEFERLYRNYLRPGGRAGSPG